MPQSNPGKAAAPCGPSWHYSARSTFAGLNRAVARPGHHTTAAAQDYAQMLVASGQGRWRTVAEVLQDARSWP